MPSMKISGVKAAISDKEIDSTRIAVVGPAGVVKSWRIRSTTPLAEIQLAKDCGSLAVLISIVIAGGVWGIALIERLIGAPI